MLINRIILIFNSDDKRPDAKQPDVKRPDDKRPDAKQPDVKRPDAKRPDAKRPASSIGLWRKIINGWTLRYWFLGQKN
jgi:hypothetical protein